MDHQSELQRMLIGAKAREASSSGQLVCLLDNEANLSRFYVYSRIFFFYLSCNITKGVTLSMGGHFSELPNTTVPLIHNIKSPSWAS